MIRARPYEPRDAGAVRAFWRELNPDWTWLDDPELRALVLEPNPRVDRLRFVVEDEATIVGIATAICVLDTQLPRDRYIHIDSRAEHLGDWLGSVLGHFAEADREHPGIWQVAVPPRELQDPLTPYLEAAGFMYRSTTLRMGWEGERVTVVDATPVRLSGYAGGDPETDAAIVELHNRSYDRLIARAEVESLWMRWDGLEAHEYVLAREGDRLVGYAEWRVTSGEAWISSLVVARSHWGTNVAPACATKTMEHLVGLGYHKVFSNAVSTKAPTIKLHRRMGFRVVAEELRTFVRTL